MAEMLDKQVGFPMGEEIVTNGQTIVEIHPATNAAGDVLETGEIVIRIPYRDATVKNSDPLQRPRLRMFSVCNSNPNKIFNDITGVQVIFSTTTSTVVDPMNAPKELKIYITGTGEKKNSPS